MNKGAKVSISIVAAIIVVLAIIGLVLLLLRDNGSTPSGEMASKLNAPENVQINDDWVLSFSPVANAVGYSIYVNGNLRTTVQDTSVDVSRYTANPGSYSFYVQALHELASFTSNPSNTVSKDRLLQLDTPSNLIWTNTSLLSWGQVDNVVSYTMQIRYGDNIVEELYSTANEYDFANFFALHQDVNEFAISVKATSRNITTNVSNQYILESGYSEAQYYYRIRNIEAPEIRADFDTTQAMQGGEKIISWDTNYFVEEYYVLLNNTIVRTITADEFDGVDRFELDLNTLVYNGDNVGDSLGEHSIYILAQPRLSTGVVIPAQASNTITYTVVHKLDTPSGISLYKEGSNLVIEWDDVDMASSYNIYIWGNIDPDNPNYSYIRFSTNSGIGMPHYTLSLNNLDVSYKSFRVQVQACRNDYEYIINSDWSELSEEYSAMSKLNTPDGMVVGESGGVYTLTWRAVNSTAVSGYLTYIYEATISGEEVIPGDLIATVSTQANEQTRVVLSDYLANHPSGDYAVRIIAVSNSAYYENSDYTDYYSFTYRTRLATPQIITLEKENENVDKSTIIFEWSYVDGADEYLITVDNAEFRVSQPTEVQDTIVDTTILTNYINQFNEPKVYRVTVQAIVLDSSSSNLSSLVSETGTLTNRFQHAQVSGIRVEKVPDSNDVYLYWDAVDTVAQLGGNYRIYVNDSSITTGNTQELISNYLRLGNNEISIVALESGLYSSSTEATVEYNYTFDLNYLTHSNLIFELVDDNGTPKIQITIPAFSNFVTDYYLEFSSGGAGLHGTCVAGEDCIVLADFTQLPLYETTTITVHAGVVSVEGDVITPQDSNLTPISWEEEFANYTFIDAPNISYSQDDYTLTISLNTASLEFAQMIEWTVTSDTGVNYRDYITESDGQNLQQTYSFNLNDLGIISDSGELIVGAYTATATVYSRTSGIVSDTTDTDFIIGGQLVLDEGSFVQADDNNYLQWDDVDMAGSYEIIVTYSATENGPYSLVSNYTPTYQRHNVYTNGVVEQVIRLDTSTLFTQVGFYRFTVTAVAEAQYADYIQDSEEVTYSWNFSNQLRSPSAQIIERNGGLFVEILYQNLVGSYTVTIGEETYNSINLSDYSDSYVYVDVSDAFIYAGEYEISVVANPKNTDVYTSSAPKILSHDYTLPFNTPTLTVSQNQDNLSIVIADWGDVVMQTVDGSSVSPQYVSLRITTIEGQEIQGAGWDDLILDYTLGQYQFTPEIMALLSSGNYVVYIRAEAYGYFTQSAIGSVRFAYQEQTTPPTISFGENSYATLEDTDSLTLNATNLDPNGNNQFDIRFQKVDIDTGEIIPDSEVIFENLTWTTSGQENTFAIRGGTHITERGIYAVSVRTALNGKYAASRWSDETLYIYYAVTMPQVQNISLAKDTGSTTVTVSFNALTSEYGFGNITYKASVNATISGVPKTSISVDTITVQDGVATFTFDLTSFGGETAWVDGNVFSVVITATSSAVPFSNTLTGYSELGGEYVFAITSNTTYQMTIGTMSAPTNVEFADNGDGSYTITWQGDTQFSGISYNYTIAKQDDETGETSYWDASLQDWVEQDPNNPAITENSVTFTYTGDFAQLITVTLSSTAGEASSGETTQSFAISKSLDTVTDLVVTYDEVSEAYQAEWTLNLPNGQIFNSSVPFTLTIGGITAATGNISTAGTTQATISADIIAELLSIGRDFTWTLNIQDRTYTDDQEVSYIGYTGNTSTGKVTLPVVITSAPVAVSIDSNFNATWSMVAYATQYRVWIVDNQNAQVVVTESTPNLSINIRDYLSSLALGECTLYVQVAADAENNIYITDSTEAGSVKFNYTAPRDAVNNLRVNSQPQATGDFSTSIEWYYSVELPADSFELTITSVDTSESVTFPKENFNSELMGSNNYRYTLDYTGADNFTRSLLAGDYVITVVVKGDGQYYTDSEPTSTNYVNQFGLRPVTNIDDVFRIAPEGFILDGEINSNEVSITDENRQEYLSNYETTFGFNTKYIVIVDDTATKATHYKVLLNGVELGMIENKALATFTFDDVASGTKLNLRNWNIGINDITLIPWGDEDYYYYIEPLESSTAGTAIELSGSLSDGTRVQDALATTTQVTLYYRYDAPSNPTVYRNFSDLPDNHNLNEVDITFRNATLGGVYSVVVYYLDYYDSNNQKTLTLEPITLTSDDYINSTQLGLKVYDLIKHLGPHQFWFEVRRVISGAEVEGSQYYLNSFNGSTVDSPFVFTTELMPFLDAGTSGQDGSIVVPITSENTQDFVSVENGYLSWTAPTHPYSIQVTYTVTMADEGSSGAPAHHKSYSATLVINNESTTGSPYSWASGTNTDSLFRIGRDAKDNVVIYFDMTEYFEDSERAVVDGINEGYYLAGQYYYMIDAVALDKNGATAPNRIYSPDSYGTLENMKSYTYENVNYPFAPTNVRVDSNGILTWDYENDDLYPNAPEEFVITIINYDENGVLSGEVLNTNQLAGDDTHELDISEYLVAGGANRNEIFIYRVAPDDYFNDSQNVLADASALPTQTMLPDFVVDWSTQTQIGITLPEGVPRAVFDDITNPNGDGTNAKGLEFRISILQVYNGQENITADDTFDSVQNNPNVDFYILNNVATIPYNIYGVNEYSLNLLNAVIAALDEEDVSLWISGGDSFVSGTYFLKVQFTTNPTHTSYADNTQSITREVKDIWRTFGDTTLKGENLIVKANDGDPRVEDSSNQSTLEEVSRAWGYAGHKEAILTFRVNTITDWRTGQLHLPSIITVTARLFNGTSYDLDNVYTLSYEVPTIADLGSDESVTIDDVTISRYWENGVIQSGYMMVSIDLHGLFDTNPYGGVYHINWSIEGNEYGDSMGVSYTYPEGLCHYTILPTPSLDYRLDYTQSGAVYQYVLNWSLMPTQYTHDVAAAAAYNVNIYAFEQREDGTYACDDYYNSLTGLDKIKFLQDTSDLTFSLERSLVNFSREYYIDGRRCYVNEASNTGLDLVPNHTYKFFIYLTASLTSTEANATYYLSSDTSAPMEYTYTQISTAPINNSINTTTNGVYALEGSSTFDSGQYYTILSTQDTGNYNNQFELYIYDTQDPRAGEGGTVWMLDQEENGTYLAHYIIGTLDNANANSRTQNLYILEGYEDRVVGSGTYGDQIVGTLSGSNITLNLLTLQQLLDDKTNVPITYYCKIKAWIDNNTVNKNAPLAEDGTLADEVIYGADWIRRNITTDESEVSLYVEQLADKVINLPYLDANAYNPSAYFTFQHIIKFATPQISEIQILNNSGYEDIVGGGTVSYASTSTGTIDGYISAESNGQYYYKIYLDNVYSNDELIKQDKYIRLTIYGYNYNSTTGELDRNSGLQVFGSAVLKVYDEGTRSYVLLSSTSTEGGAQDLYWLIDENLPNELSFSVVAVQGGEVTNAGGANTTNSYVDANGVTQTITRTYADSDISSTRVLIVKKQYTAPSITMMYDNMTETLVGEMQTNEFSGLQTNVLASGEYAGMALNPYVYVDGADYPGLGAQDYEYAKLTYADDTQYRITVEYSGQTSEVIVKTNTINALLTGFTQAVRSNPDRYDYSTYTDIYPYADASLYSTIYNLIKSVEGDYQGGLVNISIQTLAGDSTDYWVDSDARNNFSMYFYARLDTVQTSFNQSEAVFGDTTVYASFYRYGGYYYNYQTDIPFKYTPISKTASNPDMRYYVYLTRPYVTPTGTGTDTLEYSYDTFSTSTRDRCVSIPTGMSLQTFNLSTMLSVDLNDPSTLDANLNQWRLSSSPSDVWTINILAMPTNSMSYITRGFDSYPHTYSPELKLVNDITTLSVDMEYNRTAGTVEDLTSSHITYSSINTQDHFNRAAQSIVFEYVNDLSDSVKTKTYSVSQSDSDRYYNMIIGFIQENYINDASVIGGEYRFRFYFNTTQEDIYSSPFSTWYTFKYYKEINGDDISVSISTSGTTITLTGTVGQILTVTGIDVSLDQTVLNGSSTTNRKTSTRSTSGSNYVFTSNWTFSSSYADAFTSTSYSSSDATKLTTQGYVSSTNKGYIQGGMNYFTVYPTQSSTDAQYNLLPTTFTIPASINFIIPQSLSPSVSLSYTTSSDGGGTRTNHHTGTTRCGSCGGSGTKTVTESKVCPNCGGDGLRTCSACRGSGTLTYQVITGYGSHVLSGLHCSKCGKNWISANIGSWGTCPSNPQYGTKSVECDRCHGTGDMACFYCGTTGKITNQKEVDCASCGGDGRVSYSYTTTTHYAYYVYINTLTASFSNSGGATATGNWTYRWTAGHSGACTGSGTSGSNSSSSITALQSVSIRSYNANSATYSVTVRCKSGFESVFARPSYTTSISPNVSSRHYEQYTS